MNHGGSNRRRVVGLAILGFVLISLFQNCGGYDSTKQATLNSNGDPLPPGTDPNDPLPLEEDKPIVNPPILKTIPNDQTIRIGMGNLAGTTDLRNLTITAEAGAGETDLILELRCRIRNSNAIRTEGCGAIGQNGQDTFRIRADDGVECSSGNAQIELQVRAVRGQYESFSNQLSFNVTIENACLPESKLTPAQLAKLDQFGDQVAIDGNFAAVSAPGDDDGGSKAGALYIYMYDGANWNITQKLVPNGAAAGDSIRAIDIDSSSGVLVIGSAFNDSVSSNSGAAYIFELSNNNWTQTAQLLPSVTNNFGFDYFGFSVAVSGTTAIVGAPGDNLSDTIPEAGSVYVYEKVNGNWTEQVKLAASTPIARGAFGSSVAMSGSDFVVGAPRALFYEAGGTGQVYFYEPDGSGGFLEQKLPLAQGLANGSRFGFDVSISPSSNRIIGGAPSAKDGNTTSGGAILYLSGAGGTFAFTDVIFPSDGSNGDNFGSSVETTDTNLFVGAPDNDSRRGAVYQFKLQNGNWNQFFKVQSRDRKDQDQCGSGISISGQNLILGCRLDDEIFDGTGAAFIDRFN